MINAKYKAIRPYYYGLGKEYGLDQKTVDSLLGYDENTGTVSFGGKNLGKPAMEYNGTSYWDENKLNNEWNNYIKNNGLTKNGQKSQNNSKVTEGYNPYNDIKNIYSQKKNWSSANASGNVKGQNTAANAAQTYYNSLRENGYGSVADELEGQDGHDDFTQKYYGMIGVVPFRDYMYQKGAQNGFSKSDIDKLIAYNDVTGEVSFGGKNLGKPFSEINGTSYWNQSDLDKYYSDYMQNGGSAQIPASARYNQQTDLSDRELTQNRNKSEAEIDALNGYYSDLVKNVLGGLDGFDTAKNVSDSKDYKNAFNATMAKYDLAALQGRDNAAASAAASNGGNIDSYAAANAMRQQSALTSEGLAAANKMGLDAYNASLNAYNSRVDRVNEILSNLGVRTDNAANIRRGYSADRSNLTQQVFDNDQAAQNNDVERKKTISEITGYTPREWSERDNVFLNEDGTLKDQYLSADFDNAGGFQDIINKARERGDKETEQQAMQARAKKILGNYAKYGVYDNGDYSVAGKQKTENARQFDEQLASAERISDSQNELAREELASKERMNQDNNATDRYSIDTEAALAASAAASNGGNKSGGSGGNSSGGTSGGKPKISASQAKKEIEEGNINDGTVNAYNYYYDTDYTTDDFNIHPSGNLEPWKKWANGRKVNFDYDTFTGYLTYVGDGNYDTQVELVKHALNDKKLSENEKAHIAGLFSASVLEEAQNMIKNGR